MPVMMPWEHSGSKVTAGHRDRLAMVYVRQSTRQQVTDHAESTRLQYALVDRAVTLGWVASRVVVIDDDLGKSASGLVARAGFARLVAEISLGHVGLVLGIEMSRLARSGKDWYQLLELCALSGALLADTDGVYDPADYNDRLLLGLKGTMSEAELHLIKQRMQAGRIAKARRGELGFAVPTGYWRSPGGQVILDPDEQVQAVVRLVFAKFSELGSIQGVTRYLVEHGIEMGICSRSGPDRGALAWKRPARATLTCMLNSPIYAGIYVWGRRRRGQRPASALPRTVRPADEWLVRIEGLLPAYISVEQYQANLARLAANRPGDGVPGAVRHGPALLAGLLRCGRCRRKMTVTYHTDQARTRTTYQCAGARAEYGGPNCQHTANRPLDEFVTTTVLAALTPAAATVSITAAQQLEADRAALEKIWQQRLERAAYDVDHARRCYRLAEPENRLVARQLETEWEHALTRRQQLEEDYHRFEQATPRFLTPADKAAITAAAADLPALWSAPTTTDADRKEILRAVIDEVVVTVRGGSELVDLTVTWDGGHTTSATVTRPVQYFQYLSYYPQLCRRTLELADQGLTPDQIANQLTAEGFRSARGEAPIRWRVVDQILRRAQHSVTNRKPSRPVDPTEAPGPNEWLLPELAAHLTVTTGTIHTWQHQGILTGRQETRHPHRWILHAPPEKITELRERLGRIRGHHTRVHPKFAADIPPAPSA